MGPTSLQIEGTIAGVLENLELDANLALRGASLAELFDVLAIPLPETNAYRFAGHLTHSDGVWSYEKFSGRIGHSDVAGLLQFKAGLARPLLTGELAFKALDLADLGPVVGRDALAAPEATSLRGRKGTEPKGPELSRALPARSFARDRWTSVDADVRVTAQTILRPQAPLEHLSARLQMRESVLTLDPLDFGAAGGDLVGTIRLDGQHDPIRAHAKLDARKLQLGKLLPTIALARATPAKSTAGSN
jgi:AsmA protein